VNVLSRIPDAEIYATIYPGIYKVIVGGEIIAILMQEAYEVFVEKYGA